MIIKHFCIDKADTGPGDIVDLSVYYRRIAWNFEKRVPFFVKLTSDDIGFVVAYLMVSHNKTDWVRQLTIQLTDGTYDTDATELETVWPYARIVIDTITGTNTKLTCGVVL